jgi:hypothetical protein
MEMVRTGLLMECHCTANKGITDAIQPPQGIRNEELGMRNSTHPPGGDLGGGVEIENSKLKTEN